MQWIIQRNTAHDTHAPTMPKSPTVRSPKKGYKCRAKSPKRVALGKRSPWPKAVSAARKELKIKGFMPVKKGTPLYKRAKELMGSPSKKRKSPSKSPSKGLDGSAWKAKSAKRRR